MTKAKQGELHTAVLNALKDGECQPVSRLAQVLEGDKKRISKAASVLVQKGLLKRVSKGLYQLTAAGLQVAVEGRRVETRQGRPSGPARPRNNTFRQRAWLSMRIRGRFTIGDIVADAGRGNEEQDYGNAMRFVRQLNLAGIVGEMKSRQKGSAIGSNGHKRFILRSNLGPRAPAYRSADKVLHDFNSGKDFPCDQA